jgi:hypothetical protein
VKVVVSVRAARAAERIAARWQQHADYPDTFKVEFDNMLDTL